MITRSKTNVTPRNRNPTQPKPLQNNKEEKRGKKEAGCRIPIATRPLAHAVYEDNKLNTECVVNLRKCDERMPARTVRLPVSTQVFNRQRVQVDEVCSGSNAETISADIVTKLQRRTDKQQELHCMLPDIVKGVNEEGCNKPGPSSKMEHIKPPSSENIQPVESVEVSNNLDHSPHNESVDTVEFAQDSILLSDDDDDVTLSVLKSATKRATKKCGLRPSFLSNPQFIKVVARGYQASCPLLDEETAFLVAQHNVKKAVQQLEATGKSFDSGPVYDIAVKALGPDVLQNYQAALNELETKIQETIANSDSPDFKPHTATTTPVKLISEECIVIDDDDVPSSTVHYDPAVSQSEVSAATVQCLDSHNDVQSSTDDDEPSSTVHHVPAVNQSEVSATTAQWIDSDDDDDDVPLISLFPAGLTVRRIVSSPVDVAPQPATVNLNGRKHSDSIDKTQRLTTQKPIPKMAQMPNKKSAQLCKPDKFILIGENGQAKKLIERQNSDSSYKTPVATSNPKKLVVSGSAMNIRLTPQKYSFVGTVPVRKDAATPIKPAVKASSGVRNRLAFKFVEPPNRKRSKPTTFQDFYVDDTAGSSERS